LPAFDPDITGNKMLRLMIAFSMLDIRATAKTKTYIKHSDLNTLIPKYVRNMALHELEKRGVCPKLGGKS
jgi:hypothetical protein